MVADEHYYTYPRTFEEAASYYVKYLAKDYVFIIGDKIPIEDLIGYFALIGEEEKAEDLEDLGKRVGLIK